MCFTLDGGVTPRAEENSNTASKMHPVTMANTVIGCAQRPSATALDAPVCFVGDTIAMPLALGVDGALETAKCSNHCMNIERTCCFS